MLFGCGPLAHARVDRDRPAQLLERQIVLAEACMAAGEAVLHDRGLAVLTRLAFEVSAAGPQSPRRMNCCAR